MMKYASLALLLALTLGGGSAHAQLLNGNGSIDIGGNASTGDSDTSVSADVNADADASVSDSDTATGTDASASGQGMGSANAGVFSIIRSEMDEGTDYAVTEADSVRSSASLESYAGATVRADERLDSVEMNERGMEMTYRKPAKFLWIIPASIKAHVAVDAQGEVSVRYPWYSFLFSTDESHAALEAEIQNEIDAIDDSIAVSAGVSAAASAGIQADSTIRRWARIIEAAYVAVSGDARVDASAQAAS